MSRLLVRRQPDRLRDLVRLGMEISHQRQHAAVGDGGDERDDEKQAYERRHPKSPQAGEATARIKDAYPPSVKISHGFGPGAEQPAEILYTRYLNTGEFYRRYYILIY